MYTDTLHYHSLSSVYKGKDWRCWDCSCSFFAVRFPALVFHMKPFYLIRHKRERIPTRTDGKTVKTDPAAAAAPAGNADRQKTVSIRAASVRTLGRVFIKLSPHYHAWDMWAGAASSSLTCLGHIEVIFPRVYTTLREKGRVSGGSNCPLWGRQRLHECGLWVARGQQTCRQPVLTVCGK